MTDDRERARHGADGRAEGGSERLRQLCYLFIETICEGRRVLDISADGGTGAAAADVVVLLTAKNWQTAEAPRRLARPGGWLVVGAPEQDGVARLSLGFAHVAVFGVHAVRGALFATAGTESRRDGLWGAGPLRDAGYWLAVASDQTLELGSGGMIYETASGGIQVRAPLPADIQERDVAAWRARAERSEAALAAVYRSSSWRVTRGLRWLARVVARLVARRTGDAREARRAGDAREAVPEAVPRIARPETSGHVWHYLGDTVAWLRDHGQVTGIGRVTIELFLAAGEDGFAPCVEASGVEASGVAASGVAALGVAASGVAALGVAAPGVAEPALVLDPAAAALLAAHAGMAAPAAHEEMPARANRESARSPAAGDHVLFTGTIWTAPHGGIFNRLTQDGVAFSVFIYDIIPFQHPEFVSPEHLTLFAARLTPILQQARFVFVSSLLVGDEIRRWAVLTGVALRAEIVAMRFGARPVAPDQTAAAVDGGNFVLCVGTIDARKNQILACRLWVRLVAALGDRAPRLVLAGRDDLGIAQGGIAQRGIAQGGIVDGSADIAALVRAGRIVVLSGAADAEIARLYRDCLLTIFPSLSEGHGLPVAESLSFGKLCLSSDLPVIREHAGDLAWYFPPDDAEAAYACLRLALDDPIRLAAAEARIRAGYVAPSWSAMHAAIAETLRRPPEVGGAVATAFPWLPAPQMPGALATARMWCGSAAPEVSILIVNWNAAALTLACVRHVWAVTTGVRYEIIIVDNGSAASDLASLRGLGDGVRLLALGINRFFGEANNIAAEQASGSFLCLLNNDAFPEAGWLERLRDGLLAHPEAGAAGPLFLFPDGRAQEAGGTIGADGVPERHWRGQALSEGGAGGLVQQPVDYISAACLLLPRARFLAAGGFDPAYEPAYYEDVDLCFRLRAMGHPVWLCPEARVVHIEGASANGDAMAEQQRGAAAEINRHTFIDLWLSGARAPDVAPYPLSGLAVVERARSAVIYTPYALNPGGGERVVLTIAAAMAGDHAVTIVTPHPYSWARLARLGRLFELDLRGCAMADEAAFRAAPPPDVMIVLGNTLPVQVVGRGRANYYVCQFPFPGGPGGTDMGDYRAIIAYSEYTRAHIFAGLSALQLPAMPIAVTYAPVPQIGRGGVEKKKRVILSVGRFFAGEHNKRHDLLIAAFMALRETYDGLVELHLAGSSLPEPAHQAHLLGLRRMAEGHPIVFHVNAPGAALTDLYREASVYWHAAGMGADLLAAPGQAEHFGISIVEAMSAGCVAMAFNAGGPREIITDGVDGFLWSDMDSLVELTTRVLDDDFEDIRTAAATRAADFSPEAFIQRILGVQGQSPLAGIQGLSPLAGGSNGPWGGRRPPDGAASLYTPKPGKC